LELLETSKDAVSVRHLSLIKGRLFETGRRNGWRTWDFQEQIGHERLPSCFFARGHDRRSPGKQDMERHHISKMTEKFGNGLIVGLDTQNMMGPFQGIGGS
jgi:hypothetical protein